jgi:O-antigen/teichoic acid export membrane protein
MTPIWGAVSDAMAKMTTSGYKIERQLLKVWLLGLGGAILMFIFSEFMYNLWIGKKILIHWQTSLGVMLYVLSMTFGSIYVNILNGLGQLKTQFNISIVTMILLYQCVIFLLYI